MKREPKEKLPKLTEKRFSAQVVDLAKHCGYRVYHTWNSLHSAAGFPDLVLVNARQGRVIFAELKVGKNMPTPAQYEWLGELIQCKGVETYCWWPWDIEKIASILMGKEEVA